MHRDNNNTVTHLQGIVTFRTEQELLRINFFVQKC